MRMRILFLAWCALFLFSQGATAGTSEIDAVSLKKMMEEKSPLVIFPLSPIEFDHLHISGSVNIPMEDLVSKLPADKDRPLVFYCLGRT